MMHKAGGEWAEGSSGPRAEGGKAPAGLRRGRVCSCWLSDKAVLVSMRAGAHKLHEVLGPGVLSRRFGGRGVLVPGESRHSSIVPPWAGWPTLPTASCLLPRGKLAFLWGHLGLLGPLRRLAPLGDLRNFLEVTCRKEDF